MMQAQFPPFLPAGGTVGIVAPSCWPQKAWIEATVAALETRGYKALVHPQTELQDARLGGSDAARAAALEDVFANKSVDAVLCARGGCGAIRLLDKLDYRLIAQNPKPFIGFSDATVLLHAITRRTGMITFHGPMGWNFGQTDNDPRTVEDFFAVISGEKRTLIFDGVDVLRPGKAEGIVCAGNMALLQALVGTQYDWDGTESLLFSEDIDEPVYKIDRMMTQFHLSGRLAGAAAFLLGEMVDITDGEEDGSPPYGKSLEEIVLEKLPADIPVAMNVPCGHGSYITTLPVGAAASLAVTSGSLSLQIHV